MPTQLLPMLLLMAIGPLAMLNAACAEPVGKPSKNIFAKENLVAWCVVPFDSRKRTPAERTRMLKELGFTGLAWDWRQQHLPLLEEEIALLRKADIDLKAVWCWIDGKSTGELGQANDQLLATLERTGARTEIWISFAAPFFAGLTDDEKISKGALTIAHLYKKASAIGCSVSLYNHGDWFGEPRNMVKILRHLEAEGIGNVNKIGLVYNFHHAHEQFDEYESNLAVMMPYLRTVNLNGMRADGPKVLSLGSGDREQAMMQILNAAGFKGQIGILGHVEDADVKEVLKKNLTGMKNLLRRMGDAEALATY